MTFHSYDLTEKYITMLSKYKEIERYFEQDQNSEFIILFRFHFSQNHFNVLL